MNEPYYQSVLARIHHEGFGFHADAVGPGILRLLEPLLDRGGIVLELGCGSGLLTRQLTDAGHRVVATDASPAMLEIAQMHAPEADIRHLRFPNDPLPPADAIVAVGHPFNYLSTAEEINRTIIAVCQALRPDGVVAFDICDRSWAVHRADEHPHIWIRDSWVLITETSVPHPNGFVRDMTIFATDEHGQWQRTSERHDNWLIDVAELPSVMAEFGVDATVVRSFGEEQLPPGLDVIIGRKQA